MNFNNLLFALKVFAAVGCGLVAGVFFASLSSAAQNAVRSYESLRKIMNGNISAAVFEETTSAALSRALRTIVVGGITVGVLDCLAATINAGFKGVTFAQVWQYVASGLLGRDSYNHGWKTVFLGLLIHFFIAFSATTVYYAASRRFPILVRQAVLCGTLYGIVVYFVMGYVVTPLSAAQKIPFSVASMLTGIFIHIFCVGLPIALIVRRFAGKQLRN